MSKNKEQIKYWKTQFKIVSIGLLILMIVFIFFSLDLGYKKGYDDARSDYSNLNCTNISIFESNPYYKELCSTTGFFVASFWTQEDYEKHKDDNTIKILNLTEENC